MADCNTFGVAWEKSLCDFSERNCVTVPLLAMTMQEWRNHEAFSPPPLDAMQLLCNSRYGTLNTYSCDAPCGNSPPVRTVAVCTKVMQLVQPLSAGPLTKVRPCSSSMP